MGVKFNSHLSLYHGSNVDGFARMLAFDKKKKSAVVRLTNTAYFKEREPLFEKTTPFLWSSFYLLVISRL